MWRVRYYYLDYNHFVNVIRYRMHKMLKLIDAMGDSRVDNIMYECPKCKTKYDIYKALKRRNKHYKFCCDNEGCCPYMEHSQCEDAPYTLVQVAKTGQDEVQKLREKVRSQLHEDISARGSRAGIYDLLDKIGGTKLPHNFPSESRRFGIGYLPAIDYGKDGGKGKGEEGKKGGTGLFYEAAASGFGQKREAGLLEKISGETDLLEPAMKVAKTGPSFLEGSRVVREEDLMASMGAEGLKNGGLKEEEGEKEQPKQMTEEERQAEFRRQYLQAFALKQKEESMVKVEEEEEKKEEGEEEDFEWEAGDT